MYYGETLDLDNVIFKSLRQEIEVSLNAALMLADKEGKEGEVTVKIKVSTETEREFKDGVVSREWIEPRFSWAVSRKVKESKIDHKGSSVPGWELRFDEDGKPYVVEANQQSSLFDDDKNAKTVIHYHFGESRKPEDETDAEADQKNSGAEESLESEAGSETDAPETDSEG